MKTKVIKVLSLIGALATGVALITAGQLVEGAGIITAALSSASVFGKDA